MKSGFEQRGELPAARSAVEGVSKSVARRVIRWLTKGNWRF